MTPADLLLVMNMPFSSRRNSVGVELRASGLNFLEAGSAAGSIRELSYLFTAKMFKDDFTFCLLT